MQFSYSAGQYSILDSTNIIQLGSFLTGSHELVDFLRAALRPVHAVVLLQQLVHLREVNPWVRRHPIGGNLPQQNPKRCETERKC